MATRKRTTTRRKKKTSTVSKSPSGTTSFTIEVPVRNVTFAQAKRIKANARRSLTGAKFRKI